MTLAVACAFVIVPILIIVLCQRIPWLDKLGVVVLSFGLGIALAAILQPNQWLADGQLLALQSQTSEIAIALALPLLLFSIDVKASLTMAGDTGKAMAIALVAVIVTSAIGAVMFQGHLEQIWQVAGMSVGAYTGGGPNMAAIKTAIEADDNIFVTMTTYDILMSSLFLLFVMTLAKPLFSKFLRPFQSHSEHAYHDDSAFSHMADETANAYRALLSRQTLWPTLQAFLLAAVVVGLAVVVAGLFPASMQSTLTIICITSFGLAASFIPYVRALANSFQLGMFLILVFCFTMGTMTDTSIITQLNVDLFLYIGFILVGSMLLQALMCRWLDIDTDTFLITSSAAIMSVPFIPVIAGALKNRDIILPGFAAAIIGYAIGNYLGVMVAYAVRYLTA
ncbi:hypothetical protein CHH28_17940 [Bacterioplanes sanyensis]|uniref:DUF819 domain-containing protein n=1 Tax=Bacterioplanes sanyensis TaxID=1249553 RepID=A0A222FPW7_9GAMM|nr:DUF819 family protein [Bacterioplanes sanyensis]ASP40441.1 hypothetical protein CHH28_17940 [Bacterioplanes sanyensis]